MKSEKLKKFKNKSFNFIKFVFKPDWKRIAIFIILFMILPQRVSDEFTIFGGVYLIKYLVETYEPIFDLTTTILILIGSYLAITIVIWVYEKKVNKFIVNEGEEEAVASEEKKEEEKAA